ncbi:PQQ-binding-like beta-propeller repeat protein [bacterium]|nr:PQQ-binding-like beta-propeller repeat protein [Candidatus Peregrinibacteria bacterium]NCS96510.1 PQQ-binding-like beta-propeller repeat protein [bacterium]
MRTNLKADEPIILRATQTGKLLNWLFDIRALVTKSDDLNLLAEVFWDKMEKQWPFQVGGLEVGAIPLVAAIVMKGREKNYNVNSFMVRKSRKKAGLCKQIEGTLTSEPVVVVDDLINSGHSMRRVVAAVEQEGQKVDTIFTYLDFERESAHEYMTAEGIKYRSVYKLSDFGLTYGSDQKERFFPDENTLKVEWVYEPPMPNYVFSVPHSGPAQDDDKIYYGADNGYFYAVDKRTGQKVWEFQTGESIKGIFSSPVLTEKGVIFGAYDGSVYHLDRNDGTVIWEAAVAEYVGSSPCLAPELNLVFIGLEHNIFNNRGALVALNLETGEKEWEQFTQEYMHSTPAYCAEERLVTVGCNDGKVLLLDAKSGRKYWEFIMEGPLKAAPTFDMKRRQIIAPAFDKNCYGIDIDSGEENFRFSAGHVFYNTALVVEDKLYVGSCDKNFYIYDLAKNKLLKTMPTTGRILSHPRYINNSVWFGANDGGVRQIDFEGNYLGGVLLPERPVTPVIYDEKINRYYVVTMGNFLVCMEPIPVEA